MSRFSRFVPSSVTNFSNSRRSHRQPSKIVDDKILEDRNHKPNLNKRQDAKNMMIRVPSVSFPLTNSEPGSQMVDGVQGGRSVSSITINKSTKISLDPGETDSTVSRLPEEQDRISDNDLEMSMLDGTWNMRRVVWTKSKIAFARVGEEMMIDAIPLDQVDTVQVMAHEFDSSSAVVGVHSDAKRSENTGNTIAACSRLNASLNGAPKFLKIHTVPDGFNSGRPYFLRSPDEERCHEVASELKQLAEAERRRVEAKSRFERHQASTARVARREE